MKKFILPLLLLLAVGMLAAVESDPSAVVGYVKYHCEIGNNFIALPMNSGFTLVSEIDAAYPGKFGMVSMWNHPDMPMDWFTAIPGEGYWDNDFEVGNGAVLFVNANEAFDFYSMGSLYAENAQYNLEVGNNAVMIPLNLSAVDTPWMLSEIGGTMDAGMVSMWNHPDMPMDWFTATPGEGYWDNDFEISIGMPLFINANSEMTWPPTAPAKMFSSPINSKK